MKDYVCLVRVLEEENEWNYSEVVYESSGRETFLGKL